MSSTQSQTQSKVNVIHNASNVSYPVTYMDSIRGNNSPSRTIGSGSAATSISVKAKRREIAANSPQSVNFNDVGTTKTYSEVQQTSQNNTQQKTNTNPIKHLVQTKPMSSAEHYNDFTPTGMYYTST